MKAKQTQTLKEELATVIGAAKQDTKQLMMSHASLIVIPLLLGETLEAVLCPQSKEMTTPSACITHSGDHPLSVLDEGITFSIIVEGETICETEDILSAMCLLMCVHYVFNLVYSKKAANTMTFLQRVVLNITDDTPAPSKVVKLLYDINANLACE